jgi:hypothetical protein
MRAAIHTLMAWLYRDNFTFIAVEYARGVGYIDLYFRKPELFQYRSGSAEKYEAL